MISSRFPFFKIFILFFLFFFFISVDFCSSSSVCRPSFCSEMGPQIRFPFRLIGIQNYRCGYPGFDLSCTDQGQTILHLPASGDFEVTRIDYTAQAIYINDPELCLPKRISNFNTYGSKFRVPMGRNNRNYTFYNCSSDWISYTGPDRTVPLFCLGNKNYTVLATTNSDDSDLPSSCILMPNVSVPLRWSFAHYWSTDVFSEDIELIWTEPSCRNCEIQGQFCGFSNSSSLEVACSDPPHSKGLPRSAKYGVIIGVGIPGLVCMIGLACYGCNKLRNYGVHRQSNTTDQSAAATVINPQRSISMSGLDDRTIESYPKTVLGESRRLPKPSDGTCPICLSDYQPKESLRTIPECNHYFHADCIDEWLKLNGTCPLCRNALDSSTVTPCSSVSSTFSSSTSAA